VDDVAIVIPVLLAAVPEFGALDTAGHLPLLVIPCMARRPCNGQHIRDWRSPSPQRLGRVACAGNVDDPRTVSSS
jgi:hypothetical protein